MPVGEGTAVAVRVGPGVGTVVAFGPSAPAAVWVAVGGPLVGTGVGAGVAVGLAVDGPLDGEGVGVSSGGHSAMSARTSTKSGGSGSPSLMHGSSNHCMPSMNRVHAVGEAGLAF